jgi:hypothetical protein
MTQHQISETGAEKVRASDTTKTDARQAFADEAVTLQLAAHHGASSKFSACGGIPGASAAFLNPAWIKAHPHTNPYTGRRYTDDFDFDKGPKTTLAPGQGWDSTIRENNRRFRCPNGYDIPSLSHRPGSNITYCR